MATQSKILTQGKLASGFHQVTFTSIRALDLEMRRGGNASNSSTCFMSLLSWLHNSDPSKFRDVEVEFYGTMADDPGAEYVLFLFRLSQI